MSDISKYALIVILNCYVLVTISQTTLVKHSIQKNQTNNSQTLYEPEIELLDQTTLDYDFFSYDIINHKTLLVKFDITRTILFQHSDILYDGHLYVSKIPTTHYKINTGPFSGSYEMEINGTTTDHFTFCLVLTPNPQQKKFNTTSNRNETKTIFHKYLRESRRKQRQYIVHYCTKIGPDEDRYRHRKKQGSEGDHILLLLQLMMIGIFLAILQIAHISRSQKFKEWVHHHEHMFRAEHPSLSHDGLELLRFKTIDEEESSDDEQKEEGGEEEEDSITLSHRRLPSPITQRKRSRSPSPIFDQTCHRTDDTSIEHILESKPWLQIPT